MIGCGYAIFDTAVGRCGIAWSQAGILTVQLPEAREIDTRRRLLRLHPEPRELPPPPHAEIAIEAVTAALRGRDVDFADVALDMEGIPPFNRRVYEFVRAIPRGETRSHDEVASALRVPGALHSVTQAIGKNPFMIIVPCHRVRAEGEHAERISPNAGAISRRHLLSIEGNRPAAGRTLFDALLVTPPRLHH